MQLPPNNFQKNITFTTNNQPNNPNQNNANLTNHPPKTIQFNHQPIRKHLPQEQTGLMKKSSIFLSNPNTQNQGNGDKNLNFQPKFEIKKQEGNINFTYPDKKPSNSNNSLNINFDKVVMHSSQIISNTSTNTNFTKGGLQSLGKFVNVSHDSQLNELQDHKKSLQTNINKKQTNYLDIPQGNFIKSYDNPPKSPIKFNLPPSYPLKKQNETTNTYNYKAPDIYTNNTSNEFNYKAKLQIPYTNYNNDYSNNAVYQYNNNSSTNNSSYNSYNNSTQSNYVNPYPIGSKQYYNELQKKINNQINENKKFESQKKIQNVPTSFSKKQVSYQSNNDYFQKFGNTSGSNQISINQIIADKPITGNTFSKDKAKIIQTPKQNYNNKAQMTKDDFYIGKKLGKGQFGEVFVVKHKKIGFICAMKIIKKATIHQEKVEDQLVRQLKIQFFLHHNNVAALYGFFNDSQNVYLLLQLCSQGQLFDLLKTKRRLPQDQVREIIFQVCNGLDYIHNYRIIHRDIKPQNIIMHLGVAKICDFGWAVYRGNGMRTTYCGTPLYTSPELIRGQQYDEKIDIWAVGILTYELIVGRIPFRILSEMDLNKILSDQITFPDFVDIEDVSKDFILKILKKDPNERFEVIQLLNHPFLTKRKPSPYTFDITI